MSTASTANNNNNLKSGNYLALRWCFTINNYTEEQVAHIRKMFTESSRVRYAIFGREVGASGTPHLQGYLSLISQQRRGAVKTMLGGIAHLEQAKGNEQQNYDYCSKSGDFEEFGRRASPGKRNDLLIAKAILDETGSVQRVAQECFGTFCRYGRAMRDYVAMNRVITDADDVRGVWIYGPPGVGKSHMARQMAIDAGCDLYHKAQNKWWCGYSGEKYVLLDDFDSKGVPLGHHLKLWADKWGTTGEVKGSVVPLTYDKFIITSNYHPRDLFYEGDKYDPVLTAAVLRRFKVIHVPYKTHASVSDVLDVCDIAESSPSPSKTAPTPIDDLVVNGEIVHSFPLVYHPTTAPADPAVPMNSLNKTHPYGDDFMSYCLTGRHSDVINNNLSTERCVKRKSTDDDRRRAKLMKASVGVKKLSFPAASNNDAQNVAYDADDEVVCDESECESLF